MNTYQKTCFKCGESKPKSEFYVHPQMTDGLLGKCKECTKRDVRASRSAATRAYDVRRYAERTHEHRARIKVNAAIARGELTRPEACWKCGGGPPIEGHHADYGNPLGVIFLCKPCHASCHKVTTVLSRDNSYTRHMAKLLEVA